jgi:hypothetical protein
MIVDNSSRRKLGAGLGLSPRVVGAEIPQMALWIAAGIKTPAVILIFDLHDDRVGPQPRSPAQGFSGTQEHSCSAGMARAAGRRHRGEDNGYRWRSQPGRILKPERGAVIGDQRGDEISRAGRAPRPRGGAVRRPAANALRAPAPRSAAPAYPSNARPAPRGRFGKRANAPSSKKPAEISLCRLQRYETAHSAQVITHVPGPRPATSSVDLREFPDRRANFRHRARSVRSRPRPGRSRPPCRRHALSVDRRRRGVGQRVRVHIRGAWGRRYPRLRRWAVGHIAVGWNAAHAVERRGRGVPRGVGRIHGRIHRWSSPNAASAPVCREDLNETRDRQSEERRLAKRANTERANTDLGTGGVF